MAMHALNNLKQVLPGIFCDDAENMVVRAETDAIHLHITPAQHSAIQLYFLFENTEANKKYHITVDFKEPHANVHIRGLYQLQEKQHVDIQSTMNHFVPHCESKQIWRGVMRDASSAKFDGKIIVHPHAQKTVANLSNKNLLLSKTAEINTKPTLEIYADDVQCTHGATVGFLDQDALYYLRSRGIDALLAHQMLIDAFIGEVTIT